MIFDKGNYMVFPCPGIVFHDHVRQHWEIPYLIRKQFPFCTWIVTRGDSNQTNPEAALIHWFTILDCVCDVTGIMNIQNGVQDFTQHSPIALNTSGRVRSLPKIAKFIDHYTSGLISFLFIWTTICILKALCVKA